MSGLEEVSPAIYTSIKLNKSEEEILPAIEFLQVFSALSPDLSLSSPDFLNNLVLKLISSNQSLKNCKKIKAGISLKSWGKSSEGAGDKLLLRQGALDYHQTMAAASSDKPHLNAALSLCKYNLFQNLLPTDRKLASVSHCWISGETDAHTQRDPQVNLKF